ncbi:ABC transporter permease [Kineococcus gynurae]|uniref:ABC transporter permease n=1 Tax=Kineococcus gynurae TaxID=452979 RepID=A0ABV5LTV0_9ACTN
MEWITLVTSYLGDPASWRGPNGLGLRLGEHVGLSLLAIVLAVVVTVPVAILLGHVGKGGGLAIALGNIGRAVPVLALIALFFLLPAPLGANDVSVVLALALFSVPPLLINTYVGMRGVDAATVDAARGMGMSARQLVTRVEVPLAAPLIFTGIRLAALQTIATASVAGIVGGPGLGRIVSEGFTVQDPSRYLSGALLIAVLALAAEALLALLQRRADPARRSRGRRDRTPDPDTRPDADADVGPVGSTAI